MSVHVTTETDDEQESTTSDEGEPVHEISKDDAFHILQNSRRRAVLRYVLEQDEDRFVMRDIAEEVAAWEHDTTVQQLVSDERQRVYIALYQSHLPKLDDHDVLDYNQSRGVVETTALTEAFEPYVDDGLHAETDLSVGEAVAGSAVDDESGITNAVSTLFKR